LSWDVSTFQDEGKSETCKLLNFNTSAWEYEAPTTSPGSRDCFFGEESRRPSEVRLRQNGEADLEVPGQRIAHFVTQSLPRSIEASRREVGTYSDLSSR
jgi:hypothetical protein